MARAALVCGIDLGSASTPSYVCWLDGEDLAFDLYRATEHVPLPSAPDGRAVAAYALDGPQGLPEDPGDGGRSARVADRAARTPTQSLPTSPAGLRELRLYGPFVRNSVAIFWRMHVTGTAALLGSRDGADGAAAVCETWPRLVLRRLLGDGVAIPSKRREPEAYARLAWRAVRAQGLRAPGVAVPTVDQVDAALCALAALAVARERAGGAAVERLGRAPRPDPTAGFLREGYIVAPAPPTRDGIGQGTTTAARNMA